MSSVVRRGMGGGEGAPALRSVGVVLTTGCNLRCGYCYQPRRTVAVMPWPTVRAAVDLLLAAGASEPELVFHGGEPLAAFPLLKRAAAYLGEHAPAGIVPRLAVVTNGTLMSAEVLDFLAGRRVRTLVSIDGAAPSQELRAPGTFAALDEMLARLRLGFPTYLESEVTIGITLTSANLPHLAASVRYLLDRGVASITVAPLFTPDTGWSGECFRELDRQLQATVRICRVHGARSGGVPVDVLQPRRRRRVARNANMCRIADGHAVFVDVDGELGACAPLLPSLCTEPTPLVRRAAAAARLGPVADGHVAERLAAARYALRETRLFDGKRRKRSAYGACADCLFSGECTLCPLAIACHPGDDPDLVPPLPCALNLLAARYRRRFPAKGA